MKINSIGNSIESSNKNDIIEDMIVYIRETIAEVTPEKKEKTDLVDNIDRALSMLKFAKKLSVDNSKDLMQAVKMGFFKVLSAGGVDRALDIKRNFPEVSFIDEEKQAYELFAEDKLEGKNFAEQIINKLWNGLDLSKNSSTEIEENNFL